MNSTVHAIVWKEGKHYVSQCIGVEVSSFGSTKAESMKNLSEALELYFEDQVNHPIVAIEQPEIESVSFTYA